MSITLSAVDLIRSNLLLPKIGSLWRLDTARNMFSKDFCSLIIFRSLPAPVSLLSLYPVVIPCSDVGECAYII